MNRIENSHRALAALPHGTILTDDYGNLFCRDGSNKSNAPMFKIAWRDGCYDSGFAPVSRNHANALSGRKLYIKDEG